MFVVGTVSADLVSRLFDCYVMIEPENVLIFRACWLIELLTAPLVCTPIFVFLSLALIRFEQLQSPNLRNHLRHCVILYPSILTLGFVLITSYDTHGRSLGWGLGLFLFIVTAYAVLLNILVNLVAGRRSMSRTH